MIIKIYVEQDGDDWSLSYKEGASKQIATFEHLNTSLKNGLEPFEGPVQVVEGIFRYDYMTKRYIRVPKDDKEPLYDHVNNTNTMASWLHGIGITILLFGFLFGLLFSGSGGWIVVVAIWLGVLFLGMVLMGIGEVIRILHRMDQKLK